LTFCSFIFIVTILIVNSFSFPGTPFYEILPRKFLKNEFYGEMK